MNVSMLIFTQRSLPLEYFLKDFCKEFYKNPTNGLVADTKSETDSRRDARKRERGWPPNQYFFISQTTPKFFGIIVLVSFVKFRVQ
jgi:hypothetical protein